MPGFFKKLNEVGLMMVVTYARLCYLTRQYCDLEMLLPHWSSNTHTFVMAWREFTPTFKDVAI